MTIKRGRHLFMECQLSDFCFALISEIDHDRHWSIDFSFPKAFSPIAVIRFTYKSTLERRQSKQAFIIEGFKDVAMNGSTGYSGQVLIPNSIINYSQMELDFSLNCFGSKDSDCPHWDRTIQIYICCNESSALCGQEIGRWISPFRRKIGRWLTNVTSLMPLLHPTSIDSQAHTSCKIKVKGILDGEVWKPSLSLRFSNIKENGTLYPSNITPLYNGSFTFNEDYNKNFQKHNVTFNSNTVTKVEILSVITGHGSDENGCGEFCVTSHHFSVNNRTFSVTFDNAGIALGCANKVLAGVEPNEHGTWLYGRNGWCDGKQVDPWVIDITSDLNLNSSNLIGYHGFFNGTDPHPKSNPGMIIVYSYLVEYSLA